jgi:phosphohistidine phosphatase
MHLYLMRHAEAEKMSGGMLTDAERALTAYGRFQANAVGQELKRRNVSPVIVSSPLRRAIQTAEILGEALGIESFRREPSLAATGRAPDLAALLRADPHAQSLLLLGHQPDLGMLAAELLGFEFGFGTATIAAFESHSPPAWHFLWTLAPESLFNT